MKKLTLISILTFLLVATSAMASTTIISEGSVAMDYVDTHHVEFSMEGVEGQEGIQVIISPICKDADANYGCGSGDIYDISDEFTVTPNQTTFTGGDTVLLTLKTNITNEDEAGVYYYTVNGVVGEGEVGSETGEVTVPEFGTFAAAGLLSIVGFYIFKKRKMSN